MGFKQDVEDSNHGKFSEENTFSGVLCITAIYGNLKWTAIPENNFGLSLNYMSHLYHIRKVNKVTVLIQFHSPLFGEIKRRRRKKKRDNKCTLIV